MLFNAINTSSKELPTAAVSLSSDDATNRGGLARKQNGSKLQAQIREEHQLCSQ